MTLPGCKPAKAITNVFIDGATVRNAGTFVVQLQSAGSATMAHVTATGVRLDDMMACAYGAAAGRVRGLLELTASLRTSAG